MRSPDRSLPGLLCALATAVFAGCASAPLSFVRSAEATGADTQLYGVRVVSVDGHIRFERPRDRIAVDPGLRALVLEAAPTSITPRLVQKSYTLPVEPCTSYELAARRQHPGDADWTLVVKLKDPVAACDPDAERAKAGLIRSR